MTVSCATPRRVLAAVLAAGALLALPAAPPSPADPDQLASGKRGDAVAVTADVSLFRGRKIG